MKRKFLFLATFTVLILGGFAAAPVATQAQAEEVDIGILSPLTGALGALGQGFVDAAQLALDDINAEQSDYVFSLVEQDTETSSSSAQTAATALADAGVVGVVGAAASSSTLAAINPLKEAGIPLVSYASTSPSITNNDDDGYLFRVVPSDALQGQAAAALAEDQGVETVAVVNIDDAYGQGLASAFTNNFEGDVLVRVSYNQETTTDFSSQVTTLVDAGADAVYMVSFVSDGQAILTQLSEQGFDGDIIGADGISAAALINETAAPGISDYAKGVYGTAPTVSGSDAFNTAFEAEYGSAPSIFNAESYDAASLIAKAYMEGGDMRDALATVGTDYAGVSGTFSFDNNGDRTTANYDIWQFQENDDGDTALTVLGSYTSAGGLDYSGLITTYERASADTPINFASIFLAIAIVGVITAVRRRRN